MPKVTLDIERFFSFDWDWSLCMLECFQAIKPIFNVR
jgi:hypothetical protein